MAKEKTAKDRSGTAIALVGEDTLLGRELKEVFETRGAGLQLQAYAASGDGSFSEREGETVYVRPLDAAALKNAEAVLLAGSEEGARKTYAEVLASENRPTVIDCTGYLAQEQEARLIAPLLEEPKPKQGEWLLVMAHPAATAISLVLRRTAKLRRIQRAVVHIFEPASERGKRGLTELHQQTTGLLSFKTLEKDVFDAQLAFNMLPAYGEDAPLSLASVESRVGREVEKLLGRKANGVAIPKPSIRVVQAPVFHGYSLSFWIQFEGEVRADELGEALASAQIEVRGKELDAPNNAAAASQSGLLAGDIRIDANDPSGVWVWVVTDNLRLTADAAMDVLRALRSDELQ